MIKEQNINGSNFDFLRIVFALFVIISHSYPISGIPEKEEWLLKITNNEISFSYLGVAGFFAISGYLVIQSLLRSKNLINYFMKRVLRIYPALLCVLTVTILLGVFVYHGSAKDYVENASVWTYVPYNLSLFKLQYSISGIFADNPFKNSINGSLCTLPYEIILYFLLSFLFLIKSNKHKILVLATAFCFVIFYILFLRPYLLIHLYPYPIRRGIDYSGGFIAGSLLAFLDIKKIKYKKFIVLLMIVLWVVSLKYNFYGLVQYLVLPVTVIIIGTSSFPVINNLKQSIGDLSYGIYIYAFPIQQTLEHFFRFGTFPLMLWSAFITIPFAWMSWHFIEKKALALKYRLNS